MLRDWVRHNASQIVQVAEKHECDLIVFEHLRDQRVPGYDELKQKSREEKRWLAMFSYGKIRRKVTEKAIERGMRVVVVPEFKSSRICSACGHLSEGRKWRKLKTQGKFKCQCGAPESHKSAGATTCRSPAVNSPEGTGTGSCKCRFELDSDANASRVLARLLRGEISLPSREPLAGNQGPLTAAESAIQ
jgi:IS605 OrfB family transposase